MGEVEDATATGIPARVAGVAAWCNAKPGRCGPRLSTTPHFKSDTGGYDYATRAEAAAKCAKDGMRLCRKSELAGHSVSMAVSLIPIVAHAAAIWSHSKLRTIMTMLCADAPIPTSAHLQMCESGWCADWEGFWMATASKGCGGTNIACPCFVPCKLCLAPSLTRKPVHTATRPVLLRAQAQGTTDTRARRGRGGASPSCAGEAGTQRFSNRILCFSASGFWAPRRARAMSRRGYIRYCILYMF